MKKLFFYGWMVGILLIAVGCSILATEKEEVKVNEESFIIEKDQAEELDIELNMGVGELTVTKGTENWVEGSFDTPIKELEPIVMYANKKKKDAEQEAAHLKEWEDYAYNARKPSAPVYNRPV